MRHVRTRQLRLRTVRAAALLACIAALIAACGPAPVPCDACPAIDGTFRVDTANPLGACEFQPMTLSGVFPLIQSADTSTLSTLLTDPVTDDDLELTGEIYPPTDRDAADVVASFSISAQTVRPAVQFETELVSLLVTMSGSVTQSEGIRGVSGSLTTTDMTQGAQERCRVNITFSATQTAAD